MKTKKGQAATNETLKWIVYLAILVAAGIAVRNIIIRAMG